MSGLTGSEAKTLMEAYNDVYLPQEEISEEKIWEEVENWVNSLLEDGHDLSEYTWEEMYEVYISEAPMSDFQAGGGRAALTPSERRMSPRSSVYQTAVRRVANRGQSALFKAGGGQAALTKANAGKSPRSGRVTSSEIAERGRAALASAPKPTPARKLPSEATGVVDPKWDKPGTPVKKPAAAPKPAAAAPKASEPAPKPAALKTAPSGTPMQQWAKANPKLAAAAAERARTRGTRSTTNPLMKDVKSSLPAPKTPSPSTTKVAFAKTPQSLASTSQATTAASSTSPAASGSVAPATAKIAAAPKPAPVAPRQTAREKVLNQSYEYDAYDLVLEYLLSQGHVETLEEALYVMMEMDSETIQSIVEAGPLLPGESGKAPSSGYKEPILPGEKREVKYMKKLAPGQTQKLSPA